MRHQIFTKWSAFIFVLFVTVGANAQQNNTEFTYTVSGNEATITGFSTLILKVGAKKVDGRLVSSGDQINIVIPATINGKKVTSVAANAFRNTEADDGNVFNNVASVKFEGNNLKSIGDNAFQGCNLSGQELIIPASVDNVGAGAFACTGVKSVKFESTENESLILGDGAFYNNAMLTNVVLPNNIKKIGAWCFAFNTKAKYSSPNRVKQTLSADTIGEFAYAGNTTITEVEITAKVKSFGEGAFWCCFKLNNISVSDSSEILSVGTGDDAGVLFSKNKDTLYFFPSVPMQRTYQYMVPTTVTRIAAGAFALSADVNRDSYGPVVTTVILPTNLESIGDLAFNAYPFAKSPITHLTIPTQSTGNSTVGVTSMGYGCLPNGNLTELVYTGPDSTDYQSMLQTAFTPIKKTINGTSKIFGGDIGDTTKVTLYTKQTYYLSFNEKMNNRSFTVGSVTNYLNAVAWKFKVTIPEGIKYISLSRDFPIGNVYSAFLSIDDYKADIYVVYNQAGTSGKGNYSDSIKSRNCVIARQATYCPGRDGDNKDQYFGCIIKAYEENAPSDNTYCYAIGEESLSGKYLSKLREGNLLNAVPCMTYVHPTDTIDGKIYYNYGLYKDHKFHGYSDPGYIPPMKAYLHIPVEVTAGSKGIDIEFIEDPVDGIKDVKTPTTENSAWYNLQGLRLNEKPTTAGIYIHNGRKVVIK
ncbi:MAG: leucine-rich repeat domain-containing protein [Prevotella sp.]|jgi:hypothetical protein